MLARICNFFLHLCYCFALIMIGQLAYQLMLLQKVAEIGAELNKKVYYCRCIILGAIFCLAFSMILLICLLLKMRHVKRIERNIKRYVEHLKQGFGMSTKEMPLNAPEHDLLAWDIFLHIVRETERRKQRMKLEGFDCEMHEMDQFEIPHISIEELNAENESKRKYYEKLDSDEKGEGEERVEGQEERESTSEDSYTEQEEDQDYEQYDIYEGYEAYQVVYEYELDEEDEDEEENEGYMQDEEVEE